jgi:predicted  nucleic acid-binding Zn-ribbon protein
MSNNNLADISMFESLQNQSFGQPSQMSAFTNDSKNNTPINNIDMRNAIAALASVQVLQKSGQLYKDLIKEKKETEAKTKKDNAKILIDDVTERITKLEKEMEQEQKIMEKLKNDFKTAQKNFN